MSEQRYPLWLDVASCIVLLMIPSGLVLAFFNHTTGFLLAGLGFWGVGTFGTIASKIKREK